MHSILMDARRSVHGTMLGAVALAVGVAGLTLVAAVTWAFHGTVTSTLLGDAVSVRVCGVDLFAVAATVLLGAFAVADVLCLNVRDRAALRATGWWAAALGRLVGYEGVGIGSGWPRPLCQRCCNAAYPVSILLAEE